MKNQKKLLIIILILLVLCVAAYFAISHYAKTEGSGGSGPNAYMGDVTEAVTEEE